MSYYYEYPKYVSVAEKKEKAEKKLNQLKKKNPDIAPVIITGKEIANTWWGKEWNKNLERYADYSNRIGRGRSYVRHGAVLDLKIEAGKVTSLVQGSTSKPYKVDIEIKKISDMDWAGIRNACKGNMDNIQSLIAGKFPKQLAEIFTRKGSGLFPSPSEIKFSCSCPDSAYMCKHVAAVLYGIGARLDSDPSLFFVLRQVNMNDLIFQAIQQSKQEILSKAGRKTSRVIEDEDSLSEMFGIDLGGNHGEQTIRKDVTKTEKSIKIEENKIVPDKKKSVSKKQESKTSSKTVQNPIDMNQLRNPDGNVILKILNKTKKAMSVTEIVSKTSMSDQKVRNILYRLKEQGIIENSSRGMYQIIIKRR